MKYTILVTGAPYGTENSSSAFLFANSLIKLKHVLHSVFFYSDGVFNANAMTSPANDEFNLVNKWKNFSIKFHVPLNICISAALRRGVISDQYALKIGTFKKGNLDSTFQITGLIELAISVRICDRIIQF